MAYQFNGWQTANGVKAITHMYKGIETPIDLYDALSSIWCEYTCAPRLRSRWSPEHFLKAEKRARYEYLKNHLLSREILR